MKVNERNRVIYGVSIIFVIFLGLSSRKYQSYLPEWVGKYVGDVLWALMVFLGIGFLFKKWTTIKTGVAALLFSYVIEVSQLYHSPWIDTVRRTRLGSLILGFGFLWSDLICYTIGVVVGALIDRLILSGLIQSNFYRQK